MLQDLAGVIGKKFPTIRDGLDSGSVTIPIRSGQSSHVVLVAADGEGEAARDVRIL